MENMGLKKVSSEIENSTSGMNPYQKELMVRRSGVFAYQSFTKGFTLIELLVVIAIIALLASIVLVALSAARAKARDSKRVADIREIMTALELYYNDHSGYPANITSALEPSYVGTTPYQPNPADGSCPAVSNSTTAYTYTQVSSGASYTVNFCLGGTTGSLVSGAHTASPSGIQ